MSAKKSESLSHPEESPVISSAESELQKIQSDTARALAESNQILRLRKQLRDGDKDCLQSSREALQRNDELIANTIRLREPLSHFPVDEPSEPSATKE